MAVAAELSRAHYTLDNGLSRLHELHGKTMDNLPGLLPARKEAMGPQMQFAFKQLKWGVAASSPELLHRMQEGITLTEATETSQAIVITTEGIYRTTIWKDSKTNSPFTTRREIEPEEYVDYALPAVQKLDQVQQEIETTQPA